jgi:hypothetical protein
MKLKELIKITKEFKLIESTDSINCLFEDYPDIKDKLPLDQHIDKVLTWAYENDHLYEFYDEHYDVLINCGYADHIVGCCISFPTQVATGGSFDLYRLSEKNCYYYVVLASCSDYLSWDRYGIYETTSKGSKSEKSEVIAKFKADCESIFDCVDGNEYGEFDFG